MYSQEPYLVFNIITKPKSHRPCAMLLWPSKSFSNIFVDIWFCFYPFLPFYLVRILNLCTTTPMEGNRINECRNEWSAVSLACKWLYFDVLHMRVYFIFLLGGKSISIPSDSRYNMFYMSLCTDWLVPKW